MKPTSAWFALVGGALLLLALVAISCGEGMGLMEVPLATEEWPGAGGGWREWGSGGEWLYGVSVKPEVLESWQWDGSTLRRSARGEVVGGLGYCVAGRDIYVVDVVASSPARTDTAGERMGLTDVPLTTEDWAKAGGGGIAWGSGDGWLYGGTVNSQALESWKGDGSAPRKSAQGEPVGVVAPPPVQTDTPEVEMRSLSDGRILKKWDLGLGWFCAASRLSGNGKYLAFRVMENLDRRTPGFSFEKPRLRVGLLGPDRDKLIWAPTLVGTRIGAFGTVRGAIPSDDGAYVVVAGYENGAALLDVKNQKVLWGMKPDEEITIADAAFTPDNALLYMGGNLGCVWGVEVATGKVVSQWWPTGPQRPGAGPRISVVTVSGDGRFVAASVGPDVYVWKAKTGERVSVLKHGRGPLLIVSFSPDSKALASYAAGRLKVWRMPSN